MESVHPDAPPHYYLSLLGQRHRRPVAAQGLGMALLADNLAQIDAEGMPAYLEARANSGINDVARTDASASSGSATFERPDGRR